MLYDISITSKQLWAVAVWEARGGHDRADIKLRVDDRMLVAEIGDDRMAWDTDGSPASEEYLAAAPVNGRGA